MQVTSRAYKTEQKDYLRNESYVWVYLGVISKEAQANAEISGDFEPYSDEDKIFDAPEFEAYYATCEQNYANENMYFLPRNGSYALYQGAVTENLLGSVSFRFGNYHHLDLKGLTIDFGDFYPTEFTITNGTDSYTYTNNKAGVWTCEDTFMDTDYLTITATQMVGGNQRLRILSVDFGVGLMFSNKNLISTSYKHAVSHISGSLPAITFTFTVDNTQKKFASDDPHSFLAFLQEKQEVDFEYGRKVGNEIFTIPGGKTFLKSWSSNDQQAKFTTVGALDWISGSYTKGQYYPNGISLYDLAEDILEDAGITNYQIDTYLKKVTTHNPVPVQPHKNLLQLIANSAMAVMYEDREGKLVIKTSFEPEVTSITSNSIEDYASLTNVLGGDPIYVYATAEENFAQEQQYFLPENDYLDAGYVSHEIADENGDFTTNPTITIEFEAKWSFFNPTIMFDTVIPAEIIVYTYADGVQIESFTVDEIDVITNINRAFLNVDTVVYEFSKGTPNHRIHINRIKFGTVTDLTIGYRDMSQSPTATIADKVKDVIVRYYEYSYGTEVKDISTTSAITGNNVVTFNSPYHDYTLSYKNGESGTLTIIDSGAYFVEFSSTIDASVSVKGKPFVVSETSAKEQIHEVGTDKTCQNVLIDNKALATRQAEWLAEHYDNDLEYDVTYRGEPAIDPDDYIFLENKYVNDNLIRVTETQIDTSTGMSLNCKLSGRRVSYTERA